MFKKGFTLIEILIAMALVGVLAAVITPQMAKILPDKKKAMFLKAYSRTEMAVANMINDPEMYPTKFDLTSTEGYSVFGLCSDTDVVGLLAVTNNFRTNGTDPSNKFHFYFAQELGTNYTSGTEIETSDGLKYRVKRENHEHKASRREVVANITIDMQSDTEIGKIRVLNDGTVECGDNNCTRYLADRFNLKKER